MTDRESIAREAAAEGARARRDSKSENPYSPGTLSCSSWNFGWMSEDRRRKQVEEDNGFNYPDRFP